MVKVKSYMGAGMGTSLHRHSKYNSNIEDPMAYFNFLLPSVYGSKKIILVIIVCEQLLSAGGVIRGFSRWRLNLGN